MKEWCIKYINCVAHYFAPLDLNIFSIRWVTPKPPATLIMAKMMAITPRTLLCRPKAAAVAVGAQDGNAGKSVHPDIKGVCSRLGTFLIIL